MYKSQENIRKKEQNEKYKKKKKPWISLGDLRKESNVEQNKIISFLFK